MSLKQHLSQFKFFCRWRIYHVEQRMEFLDMSGTAALTKRAAFSLYVVMLLWFCESDFSLMFGRTIGSFACESFHHPCYVFWNYNGQCGGICEATNWSLYEIYLKLWFEKEQIGKSGISVPWLIAASPANNSHPCSKLSCVETYFGTMSLLGDDQCYNKSINHKSHNKILPQQSTFLCSHTHKQERDLLQEWKAWYKSQVQIDSHRSPNLTWSISLSWQHKIVLFAANIHIKEITHTTAEKYCPDHSVSCRSTSNDKIITQTRFVYWLQLNNSTAQSDWWPEVRFRVSEEICQTPLDQRLLRRKSYWFMCNSGCLQIIWWTI